MSRRTETAYKAIIRASQHDMTKSHGFRRNGKCCGCVATVHVLIRGDLLHMQFRRKARHLVTGCRDGAEVSRSHSRQGRHHSWRCGGWKQAGIESRKTYPAEGPNLKRGMSFSNELPAHKTRPGECMERVMRIQLPKIITVTAVFSKN